MLTQNHGLSTLFSRNQSVRGWLVRLAAVLLLVGSQQVAVRADGPTDAFAITTLSVTRYYDYAVITGHVEIDPEGSYEGLTVYFYGDLCGDVPVDLDGNFETWIWGMDGTSYAVVQDPENNYSDPWVFFTTGFGTGE